MNTQDLHAASLTTSTPVRQQFAGLRILLGTVAVLGLCLAGGAGPASAAPCQQFLQSLLAHLQSGVDGANVETLHTTNYQANSYWSTAHAWATVRPATSGAILTGNLYRVWDSGITETFTVDFYADGSVRFAGQYGPYPSQCYGNKFLTVNTSDSFETFTFEKNIFIIR
jgi:hypothetical protein